MPKGKKSKGKKKKPKQATYQTPIPESKHPRWFGPTTFEGGHLSWRFCAADTGGRWSWSSVSKEWLTDIVGRLAAFEKMGQGEIKNVRSIVSVVNVVSEAKQRLRDLERDDIDTLYGWRVGAKERVWCAQYGGMMSVLWWDSEHEVYPVPKKHT